MGKLIIADFLFNQINESRESSITRQDAEFLAESLNSSYHLESYRSFDYELLENQDIDSIVREIYQTGYLKVDEVA